MFVVVDGIEEREEVIRLDDKREESFDFGHNMVTSSCVSSIREDGSHKSL